MSDRRPEPFEALVQVLTSGHLWKPTTNKELFDVYGLDYGECPEGETFVMSTPHGVDDRDGDFVEWTAVRYRHGDTVHVDVHEWNGPDEYRVRSVQTTIEWIDH